MGLIGTLWRRVMHRAPPLLAVGARAPDFELQDDHGRTVRLSDHSGKRIVLWFFPKADTPGCTKQGCAFRDNAPAYREKDVLVFGVSFDDVAANRRFAAARGFEFPLLCDVDRRVSLAYRACDRTDDAFARRVTYVIDAEGRIERAIVTNDPGAQASELLRTL